MNELPLHPAIVHLPLGGAVLVPLLALACAWAVWKGWVTKRAWFAVPLLQSVVVVAAIVALRSGEDEEERVEERVSEATLEDHEDLGKLFAWGAGGVLVIAASVLIVGSPRAGRALMTATTLASVALLALAIVLGHSGGRIVFGPGGLAARDGAAPAADDAPERDGRAKGERDERDDRDDRGDD